MSKPSRRRKIETIKEVIVDYTTMSEDEFRVDEWIHDKYIRLTFTQDVAVLDPNGKGVYLGTLEQYVAQKIAEKTDG